MNEYTSTTESGQPQKIDLIPFFRDFFHVLKKRWWIIVALAAAGGLLMYLISDTSTASSYTASATVSVKAYTTSSSYDNSAATAEQLGAVFPYILTSGALSDIVAEDLGTDGIPGSISVTNIEGTNLLTIKATANEAQLAYDLLQSVIENYPSVAQYVVGQTELEVIEESGVPQESTSTSSSGGSVRNGVIIGAVIGLLILLVIMITFRTVRNSSDFKNLVNAPYLGTLPFYKKKKRADGGHGGINILDESIDEDYIESVRIIRTRLERQLAENGTKTFMVTSSIPGEGKSTVAANLAISLAKKGKKVVLVDCDLRNPSTQEVFNTKNEHPGIAAVLKGEAKLNDALVKVDRNLKLYCLFGAPKSTQQVDILGKRVMKKLLDTLEDFADIVILDTPPSGMLVDAAILVKYVKSAIYVVMSDFARRRYIQRGVRELDDMGITIEGCVLNGGKESSYARSRKSR